MNRKQKEHENEIDGDYNHSIPEISVIMPVYNSRRYLDNAIKSILRQTFESWELIIIDDGSTDGCGSVCDKYASEDGRIAVIHQENQGMCAARNRGLATARGRYIAFMDNDDICDQSLLEESYRAAQDYRADMVKFGREAIVIDQDGRIYEKNVRELPQRYYSREEIRTEFIKLRESGALSPVWDGLYRRTAIIQYHIMFDERLRFGEEDTIFCMQLAAKANAIVFIPGVYYIHYIRLSHSASAKFSEQSLEKFLISAGEMQTVLREFGINYRNNPEYVTCFMMTCVMEIMQRLNYSSCSYSFQKKMEFLRRLRADPEFGFYLNWRQLCRLAIRDRKKWLIVFLWSHRLYGLLYYLTGIYYKKRKKYMSG